MVSSFRGSIVEHCGRKTQKCISFDENPMEWSIALDMRCFQRRLCRCCRHFKADKGQVAEFGNSAESLGLRVRKSSSCGVANKRIHDRKQVSFLSIPLSMATPKALEQSQDKKKKDDEKAVTTNGIKKDEPEELVFVAL
jgi:hypothetical protein